MGGLMMSGNIGSGSGNLFDVFTEDPNSMPGQGLARTDNYRTHIASRDYEHLIDTLLKSERERGPEFAEIRRAQLDETLTGNSETPGISKLYLDALRLADPESAALLDSLTASASSELALDNQLDPSQLRLVEQSGRASAAARGMGFGPSDAFAESFAKLGAGDNLRAGRRNQALTLAKLRQSLAARPADMVTSAYASATPVSTQMFDTLNNVYLQNQANNRAQAELETKIGMDQADKWNSWMSMGAGMI